MVPTSIDVHRLPTVRGRGDRTVVSIRSSTGSALPDATCRARESKIPSRSRGVIVKRAREGRRSAGWCSPKPGNDDGGLHLNGFDLTVAPAYVTETRQSWSVIFWTRQVNSSATQTSLADGHARPWIQPNWPTA